MRATIGTILAVIAFLLGLTVLFGSWYTIDQGERGVLLRNGAVTGTAEPGLGFKIPWIDSVHYVSVQSQKRTYDEVASYSKDQQPASIRLSVNYRADLSAVAHIYERFGSLDGAAVRLLDPQVYEEVKNVFGRFNAVTAVQERARLNGEIETAVRIGVSVEPGILIESVQIENIDFSAAYEQSIEARMLAEVEVQKLHQNAEREKVQAEIVVIQANATADAVRAAAQADADAILLRAGANAEQARLLGEGQADAIRARAAALRDNPLIIELTVAEKWSGSLPTTMPPNGTVPFLNLPTGQ